jgi:hypothetical protein
MHYSLELPGINATIKSCSKKEELLDYPHDCCTRIKRIHLAFTLDVSYESVKILYRKSKYLHENIPTRDS